MSSRPGMLASLSAQLTPDGTWSMLTTGRAQRGRTILRSSTSLCPRWLGCRETFPAVTDRRLPSDDPRIEAGQTRWTYKARVLLVSSRE